MHDIRDRNVDLPLDIKCKNFALESQCLLLFSLEIFYACSMPTVSNSDDSVCLMRMSCTVLCSFFLSAVHSISLISALFPPLPSGYNHRDTTECSDHPRDSDHCTINMHPSNAGFSNSYCSEGQLRT